VWSPAIPKVQEPALSQPGTIPAFVAPPGLVLQSQAQDCGFVFGGFKAATSSGGFQAKVLPTATNEGGNAMPKDFPGVIFFFFFKHDLSEVSEQITVRCQPSFNGTVPVAEFRIFLL